MTKYIAMVLGAAVFLGIVWFYGQARYSAGYATAEKKISARVADLSRKHAEELARAIEETRRQEAKFHERLSKLKTIQDPSGCLDRPVPADFDKRLRDLYPGRR